MTAELEKKLLEKYPEFFEYLRNYEGPVIPIQFGFECGDGWYWLLDNLMENIQSYTKNNQKGRRLKNKILRWYVNIDFNRFGLKYKYIKPFIKLRRYIYDHFEMETYDKFSGINITQIKEKYAGLRFYFNGGDDYIWGMSYLAESMSYNICERCGSTENVHQRGKSWIYTICEKCEQNN